MRSHPTFNSASATVTAHLRGSPDWLRRYGPYALVTGASDGIGRAFASALARKGLHLILVARSEPALTELSKTLQRDHAIDCRVIALDLCTADAIKRLDTLTANTDIGLVVAAAGFGSIGPLLAQAPDEERRMLRLNAEVVLETAMHFGHRLQARGRGGLVLFGSVVGFQGVPLSANYAATKAYVQSLAEALRLEWRHAGVDVVCCAPGPVQTGFARRAGMRMAAAAKPEAMVAPTLAALGRRATVRPGGLSKLLGWSLATLPRGLRTRVLAGVMRGMLPASFESKR